MKTIKELNDWKQCCKGAYEIAKEDVIKLIDEIDGYYETIISDKCISKKELKARIEG